MIDKSLFFFKKVDGKSAMVGGISGQIFVLGLHLLTVYEAIDLGYLWYNVIGSFVVILVALIVQIIRPSKGKIAKVKNDD